MYGTAQHLWQYGTGKFYTGPASTFDLRTYEAVSFFEASAYVIYAHAYF